MQIYFIRHGQSINNANNKTKDYEESPDPHLTEKGQEQAQWLAKYLQEKQDITNHNLWNPQNQHGFGLTHIYTSLMERAATTAAPSARALGIPLTAWVDLHEGGGIYAREKENRFNGLPGRPRSFFEQHVPELRLPDHLDESGWWNRPYETDEECQPRADKVLADLLARHSDKEGQPEERVALVSHGRFFVHLMSALLKLPWRQGAHGMKSWFLLNNCSISRFDISPERGITICYLNRSDHLPAHLISE